MKTKQQTREEDPFQVPLLADAGMITESTGQTKATGQQLSNDSLHSLVNVSTGVGCLLGVISPLLSICATVLIAQICLYYHVTIGTRKPIMIFSFAWGLFVTVVLFYVQFLVYKALLKYYKAEQVHETTLELVRLRLALGTLTGILVSWAGTCLSMGFAFLDKVGLIAGGLAVIIYYHVPASQVNEEDIANDHDEEERPNIVVV